MYKFISTDQETSIKEFFNYCPNSGIITWSKTRGKRGKVGSEAGSLTKEGYRAITLNKQRLLAHRLAWFLHYGVWPEGQVDHINGIRTDNRIVNLRAVTHQENQKNQRKAKNNSSGHVGVFWSPKRKKWIAQIGKQYLGGYECKELACFVRQEAQELQGYTGRHGK